MTSVVFSQIVSVRFVRFLTVGGCTAVVDFSGLWLLKHWFSPTLAFSGAYLAAVATHFLLNKHWTFRCARKDVVRQMAEYLVVLVVTYLVQLAAFRGGLIVFHQNPYIAKACAVPPSTIVGYCLLRLRVFKDISTLYDTGN